MIADLRNRTGERLDHVWTPGRTGGDAVAVVLHGVTSHHDRPYLVALCDALGARGIASLRFSFAGNGRSEGAFADATIGKEVDDLGAVLDALPARRIACVGHSMGALVATLRAAVDRRIGALVSLAGMVDAAGFCARHFARLVPGRDVMFGRAGCVLSPAFLADARRIGSVAPAAARVAVPWLLVHGEADELVPLADAEAAAAATACAELVVIAGADHRFTGDERAMIGVVVPWLVRVLDGPR